jgi:flavin-dependent dehydrogenase
VADRDLTPGRLPTSIAILGGGPAGSAAALTLRRYLPDLAVTLVNPPAASQGEVAAVGETLSPGVLPLLDYLGLRDGFLGLGQLPAGGTASAWGGEQVVERSYLFTGRGHGWHLDRARFDAWLLARAKDAGTHCVRSRAVGAVRTESGWRIELEGDGHLMTGAVVDATGRSAWLSRQQGAAPRRDDRLVADARWFVHDVREASAEGALVESTPDGWWYSATLPGGRGVAMFMTDSDLRPGAAWRDRLVAAPATGRRLADWRPSGQAAIRAAHSQYAERVVGERWVAAGDTAAAFDPLSALGIGFALRSGSEAARVAVASIDDDRETAAAYAASVEGIYAEYRARLAAIYGLERRWPESPFWARRRAAG